MTHPTQHLYRGHGAHTVRRPPCARVEPAVLRKPTIADVVPVTWIMGEEVICAREDLELETVLDLVVHQRIGCLPIVDCNGHPIGMITKLDLVEQMVDAKEPESSAPLRAAQVMMPLALSLDEHASIAHAAAMMAVEDVHHVPIVSGRGLLIGVVSSMDIVRWLARNDGYLPGAS
jgi:CBS domain-containing protein